MVSIHRKCLSEVSSLFQGIVVIITSQYSLLTHGNWRIIVLSDQQKSIDIWIISHVKYYPHLGEE